MMSLITFVEVVRLFRNAAPSFSPPSLSNSLRSYVSCLYIKRWNGNTRISRIYYAAQWLCVQQFGINNNVRHRQDEEKV